MIGPQLEQSAVFYSILYGLLRPSANCSEWSLSVKNVFPRPFVLNFTTFVLRFTTRHKSSLYNHQGLKPDQIGSEWPNSVLERRDRSADAQHSQIWTKWDALPHLSRELAPVFFVLSRLPSARRRGNVGRHVRGRCRQVVARQVLEFTDLFVYCTCMCCPCVLFLLTAFSTCIPCHLHDHQGKSAAVAAARV